MSGLTVRTDADLLDWSLQGSIAITFPASRGASYEGGLAIARQADHYADGSVGKAAWHFAGFGRTRDQVARALAAVGHLRSAKGFAIWAGGRVVAEWPRVESVLRCYLEATGCKDPRAHCTVMIEEDELYNGLPSFAVIKPLKVDPKPLAWLEHADSVAFPCRFLLKHGAFRAQRAHPSSVEDQVQAAAVRHGCDWCPLFIPTMQGAK